MNTKIVAVFYLNGNMLKELHHYEGPKCQMSTSEVTTTAIEEIPKIPQRRYIYIAKLLKQPAA